MKKPAVGTNHSTQLTLSLIADTYPGFAFRTTAFFFSFTTFEQAISKPNTLFYTETTYHSLKFFEFPRKSYKFKFNCSPASQKVSFPSLVSRSLPNTIPSDFRASWTPSRNEPIRIPVRKLSRKKFPAKNAGFQCLCQLLSCLFAPNWSLFVLMTKKKGNIGCSSVN